jgi:hypothetical protein
MHVLFVHKEFPGHFGHLARHLACEHGVECSFVYSKFPARFHGRLPAGIDQGIRLIPYTLLRDQYLACRRRLQDAQGACRHPAGCGRRPQRRE